MRQHRVALLVTATALAPALLLATPAFATGAAATTATATTAAAATDTPVDDMSLDDLRVAVARILGDKASGKAVVREANKALDAGTADALRAFLKTGFRLAQAEDDRVAVFRILG
ncbi:ALF repeat-containing protein, partial [Streptomyces sp. Root264]|uniref:ALF repeat-containing protein n=1 Tax=Streptomyces sp. Root264 TaxID=1736503 RepID=UPI0018FE9A30